MKLNQYKEKKNNKKIIITSAIIVLLIGIVIVGKSFASFKENKSFKVMEGNFIYEANYYVSSKGSDTTGNGTKTNPYLTIQKSYDKIKDEGTIKLLSNIVVNQVQNLTTSNKKVIITSEGSTYEIQRGSSLTTNGIIEVNNQNELSLENVIVNGQKVNSTKPLINVYNSTLNLNEGTTIENAINNSSETTTRNGGGIYTEGSDVIINGATIKGNTSSYGGGIYVDENGSLTIKDCLVEDNTATLSGGGVYSKSNTKFEGGTITNNKASETGIGCGMYLRNTTSPITFEMTGGIITKNISNEYAWGGGLAFFGLITGTLSGGEISYNELDSGGGIHLVGANQNNSPNITLKDNIVIANNTARSYGGGINVLRGTLTIEEGATIKDNVATKDGGGIRAYEYSVVNMTGGTIENNNAANNGGILGTGNSTINIKGGLITKNTATNAGGGIGITGDANATITKGTISENKAGDAGGGIYFGTNSGSVLTIDGDVLISNNTGDSGGIEGRAGTFYFKNGTIENNIATGNGGGVNLQVGCTFIMSGGTIRTNTSSNAGGGVMVISPSKFEMTGGTISDNTAQSYGGGINSFDGTVRLTGGYVQNNICKGSSGCGGGIYSSGSYYRSGTTVTGNSPSNYGNRAY